MIDEAELRRMTPQERAQLLRMIAAIDEPHLLDDPRLLRWRRVTERVIGVICVGLAAWTGVLAVTLPGRYTTAEWGPAWVGFDVALLAAFAVTGWALWKRRQVVIGCLIITATLLCCDAWFDLTLDWGTGDFWLSLASALLAELPVAAVLVLRARWLLRMTMRMVMAHTGHVGPVPSLWKIPLFDTDPSEVLAAAAAAGRAAGGSVGGSARGSVEGSVGGSVGGSARGPVEGSVGGSAGSVDGSAGHPGISPADPGARTGREPGGAAG